MSHQSVHMVVFCNKGRKNQTLFVFNYARYANCTDKGQCQDSVDKGLELGAT